MPSRCPAASRFPSGEKSSQRSGGRDESPAFASCSGIPQHHVSLVIGGQQVAFGGPRDASTFLCVFHHHSFDRLTREQIPESHLIKSRRDEPLAVRRDGNRPDKPGVPRQLLQSFTGGSVPHSDDPRNVFTVQVAAIRGHDAFAIRCEGDRQNGVLMSPKGAQQFAGGDIPELHFGAPGRGQRRAVGRERERTRGHGILQDLDALAAVEVPQLDGPARLTGSDGQDSSVG